MLKIKNKFIIFIITITVVIIGVLILQSYFEKNKEIFSYVELINSGATLNNNILYIGKKEKLSIGDVIKTDGETALVVVEWGDGSITRLGGNTSINIKELYVSESKTNINIGFELTSGKSWSNVISFLGENSYFKEYFRDTEAAVRGTVFNIDLDKEYLHVTDHKLTLTKKDGSSILVDEKKPINILNFENIDLANFIMTIKDKNWERFNYKVDIEIFEGLKKQIHSDLDNLLKFKDIDISNFIGNDLKKKELYNKLLADYQNIHFIKSDDIQLFETKLELKNILIKLSDGENKTKLVENSLYDLKDIIDSKNYGDLKLLLPMFADNKDIIGEIDFKGYFKNDIIPEDLKNILLNDFKEFINMFGIDISNISLNIDDIKNINNKTNEVIHSSLDKGVEKLGNLFSK